jgi:hypothetical protein
MQSIYAFIFLDRLIEVQDARLLENENRFSSCDVLLPELSLSCRDWWGGKRAFWNGEQQLS